jgi:hypothetical protein
MASDTLPVLIETDARGRCTLPGGRGRYVLSTQPDGALLLEPASVMTEADRKFLENTALQERITHLENHPEEFVRSPHRQARKAARGA